MPRLPCGQRLRGRSQPTLVPRSRSHDPSQEPLPPARHGHLAGHGTHTVAVLDPSGPLHRRLPGGVAIFPTDLEGSKRTVKGLTHLFLRCPAIHGGGHLHLRQRISAFFPHPLLHGPGGRVDGDYPDRLVWIGGCHDPAFPETLFRPAGKDLPVQREPLPAPLGRSRFRAH